MHPRRTLMARLGFACVATPTWAQRDPGARRSAVLLRRCVDLVDNAAARTIGVLHSSADRCAGAINAALEQGNAVLAAEINDRCQDLLAEVARTGSERVRRIAQTCAEELVNAGVPDAGLMHFRQAVSDALDAIQKAYVRAARFVGSQ